MPNRPNRLLHTRRQNLSMRLAVAYLKEHHPKEWEIILAKVNIAYPLPSREKDSRTIFREALND